MTSWAEGELVDKPVDGDLAIGDGLIARDYPIVASLVPSGYGAYARILHPAKDSAARAVRWGDVARLGGGVAHGAMEWRLLAANFSEKNSLWVDPPTAVPFWNPLEGAELARTLERFTTTPHDCYFAFWEGNTALDDVAASPTKIGELRYYLSRGPVDRAVDELNGIRPHLWWPADNAWCVASHFDFTSTFVGGSEECIHAVLRSTFLEAWPVDPRQLVVKGSDKLNAQH